MEIVPKFITKHYTATPTLKTHIVLHWSTTKTLQQIYDTFMGSRKASAHYGIGEDGTIWQFVPDQYIAWHAGTANKFSIGIEHCGGYLLPDGTRAKPTQACHDASAKLVRYLCDKHNIKCNNEFIKPHNFYNATACPGSLNINYIISKANNMDNNFEEQLNEAVKWNDEIKTKALAINKLDFKSTDYSPSKLINKLDSKEKEELLVRLKELNNWLQTTSLKNTKDLDTIIKRYAYYVQSSTAV